MFLSADISRNRLGASLPCRDARHTLLEQRLRIIMGLTIVVLRTLILLDNRSNDLMVGHGFCV